jgi:NAD(P)-dependent dehydrogenase (short-subunit alcohol dehydrogenase family)
MPERGHGGKKDDMNNKTLQGKKLVVIGGSYGMGYAAAAMAVAKGAEVAIAARTESKLAEAAKRLEDLGGNPVPYKALSIEDREAVGAFFARNAPFDHLAMPGSTVKPILYDDLAEDNAHEAFNSKFWGPFWAAYDARPHMRRGGSIVFFTGVAAKRPVPGYVMGACINGALNAGTRSLAIEFAPLGIRVNAIAPGLTDTPLLDILHADDKAERIRLFGDRLPVGRVGTAEECGLGVIYLVENGFVTAQVLGIDGGHECMP